MKDYRSLASLFHADKDSSRTKHLQLAHERLEARSTFRTGIITQLGELFVAVPRTLSRQVEDIFIMEIGILPMWMDLSDLMRDEFIDDFISGELLSTNQMEGVRSTRKETDLAVSSAREVLNGGKTKPLSKTIRFGEFAKLYMKLSRDDNKLPRTLEDLRHIYDQVTQGEITDVDRPDGKLFRSGDEEIIGPHGVVHSGVSGEAHIEALLNGMLEMGSTDRLTGLFSALVVHFVFEYIHPFYDGNGRTGRYLLALYLRQVLTLPTVLSLAKVIADNKGKYYKAFSQAEDTLNCGELTFFVSDMLDFIKLAQNQLIDELLMKNEIDKRAEKLHFQLRLEDNLSHKASEILECVMKQNLFGVNDAVELDTLAQQCKCSKQTVRKYCVELERKGLVSIRTRRPLSFTVSEELRKRMYA